MPRRVRDLDTFTRSVGEQIRWLEGHRPLDDASRFRDAIEAFIRRIAASPGIGHELERVEARSLRVFALGAGLPYRVWYRYSPDDRDGEVKLLLLLHDSQDRERFDPTQHE